MMQPQASDADQGRPPLGSEPPVVTKQPRANGFLLRAPVSHSRSCAPQSRAHEQIGRLTTCAAFDMGRALPWFPLVGALLGAGVVGVELGAHAGLLA